MVVEEFRRLIDEVAREVGRLDATMESRLAEALPQLTQRNDIANLDVVEARVAVEGWLRDFGAVREPVTVSLAFRQPVARSLGGPPGVGLTVAVSEPSANRTADATACDALRRWAEAAEIDAPERRQRRAVLRRIFAHLEPSNDGLIRVVGNLNLTNFRHLTSLPGCLRVRGDFALNLCMSLTSLPGGLEVDGYLSLVGCTSLTELPGGLRVHGEIDLSRCTSLTCLPNDLRADADIYLSGCTSLASLPQGMSVGGGLYATHCAALESLPHGLRISGDLFLIGCGRLSCLPEGLQVAGDVDIAGCTNLPSLPDDFYVGGHCDLSGCTRLTALPPSMLAWPPLTNGQPHVISVDGSGIRECVVNRIINEVQPRGIRIHHSLQGNHFGGSNGAPTPFIDLGDALRFWDALAGPPVGEVGSSPLAQGDPFEPARGSVPSTVRAALPAMSNDEGETLRDFLSALRQTADFANAATRPILAARVVGLLHAFCTHPDLRERLLAQMTVAMTTCGDRLILSMNDMEIEQRKAMLDGKGSGDYRRLAASLLALHEVRRLAEQKVRSLPSVDEIEIHLAYEIRVGAALARRAAESADPSGIELPVSTRSMLYPSCARQVTDQDIDEATAAALSVVHDEAKLEGFLASWPMWHRLQRTERAATLTREAIASEDASSMTPQQQAALAEACPISLCLPGPNDLVFVHVGTTLQVFSLEALLRHWVDSGTNPMTREPLDLAQLRRPA